MSSTIAESAVIQITNVCPTSTKEQLEGLFQFIGRICHVKMFPSDAAGQPQDAVKVCYAEFDDATSAHVAMHMDKTIFNDRAITIVPVLDGKIPDDLVAMQLTPQTVAHQEQPSWPDTVVSQMKGTGEDQVINTYDPRLETLGLQQYPPLPAHLDTAEVQEVRRTIYICNLDKETTPEDLVSFFSKAGEVKYARITKTNTDEYSEFRAAYVEMSDQRSVSTCLGYNGFNYNGRLVTVRHAQKAIDKTQLQAVPAAKIEEIAKSDEERHRSRSRSGTSSRSHSHSRSFNSRRRSRSRSKGRRRHSRSRSRRRCRSTLRTRNSRSRSPRRRRSREQRRRSRSTLRPRLRSRTRSPKRPAHRPRSRTPERRRKARSHRRYRSPMLRKKARSPLRSRSRSPVMRKMSRSPLRSRSPMMRKMSRSPLRSRSPVMRKNTRSPLRSRSPVMRKNARIPLRSRSPMMRKMSRSPLRSRSRSSVNRKKVRSPSRSRSPVIKLRARRSSGSSSPEIRKKADSPRRSPTGSRRRER